MSRRVFLKIAVGAVAIAMFGFLFIRSALNVQSTPYTVEPGHLTSWTLALETSAAPTGALLVLRPPPAMASALFDQVFSRSSESMRGPRPASMPLLLRSEFSRALSGHATPDALLALARETGLESTPPTPRCVISRRISEPGVTRQMFAAVFDFPAFRTFRDRVQQQWPSASAASAFDPRALSPAVLVAATDDNFEAWYPLAVQQESDCLAPLVVE